MNNRELFNTIMNYGAFDRMPVFHWSQWNETTIRWRNEGLPEGVGIHQHLGVPGMWTSIGGTSGLFPLFEEKQIEDLGDSRIYRDGFGVVCQAWKNRSNIPHYIDFTLKTPADWEEHYKPRLQPDPKRLGSPEDFAKAVANANASTIPTMFWTGSLMGCIRDWMGVENLGYFMYDHTDVFKEMVDTIADLVCWSADQWLPHAKVDAGMGWEDICGRCGPFVSPEIFKRCVAPGYKKIRAKLEQYNIHLYGIDSDGDVSALVGPWLDAGVNIQFPVEVGTWKADGMALRKKFGKDLRIFGHFDKMTLEQSHDAVEAEIQRLMPLMRDGGFVMMPDHLITPGVALKDYQWFLKRWAEIRV
ncbi:MAG: uroporphyrinogen decarboxylase family protein [Kiritimatiellaeota bacterium]|nr:uroporphyrinogen decarboxylase family protein [Kiritimatiellota bacterium]